VKLVLFESRGRFGGLETALAEFPGTILARASDPQTLARVLPGAEVLVTTNRLYTAENAAVIRAAGRDLKWIQFITSGIDKAIASGMPSGVVVTNASGLRAFSVAEHAIFLMFGVLRRVRETEQARATETWCRDIVTPALQNLSGKHLVIVGLGAIGQEVARRAKAFDMRITGVSRASGPIPHIDHVRPRTALRDAAAEADILLLSLIYDESTKGIVSRAVIEAMKPSGVLVNIARGPLVDEPALIEALQAGRIAGAGLDVAVAEPLPPGHPFWALPNVLLTPHIGGAGDRDDNAFLKILTDNLRRWRHKAPLQNISIERTP